MAIRKLHKHKKYQTGGALSGVNILPQIGTDTSQVNNPFQNLTFSNQLTPQGDTIPQTPEFMNYLDSIWDTLSWEDKQKFLNQDPENLPIDPNMNYPDPGSIPPPENPQNIGPMPLGPPRKLGGLRNVYQYAGFNQGPVAEDSATYSMVGNETNPEALNRQREIFETLRKEFDTSRLNLGPQFQREEYDKLNKFADIQKQRQNITKTGTSILDQIKGNKHLKQFIPKGTGNFQSGYQSWIDKTYPEVTNLFTPEKLPSILGSEGPGINLQPFKSISRPGISKFPKLEYASTLGPKANVVGAAGIGEGIGKFMTSGAGIGLGLGLLGTGIGTFSDDRNPLTNRPGESLGSTLSYAGTGAGLGSMFGLPGTVIGGLAGGIYGYASKKADTKKAQLADKEFWENRKRIVSNYNQKLLDMYGPQVARARAGELEQKTYSGYDLGRNVTS